MISASTTSVARFCLPIVTVPETCAGRKVPLKYWVSIEPGNFTRERSVWLKRSPAPVQVRSTTAGASTPVSSRKPGTVALRCARSSFWPTSNAASSATPKYSPMVLLQKSNWESWTTASGPVAGFPDCFTVSFEPKTNTNVSTQPDGSRLLKLALAARSLICSLKWLGALADTRRAADLGSDPGPLGGAPSSPQAASRRGKPIAATSRDAGRGMRLSKEKKDRKTSE